MMRSWPGIAWASSPARRGIRPPRRSTWTRHCNWIRGTFVEAEKAYAKAFELAPNANSAVKLFQLRERLNLRDSSLTPLEAWVKANPEDAASAMLLAGELTRRKQSNAARRTLESKLERQPDYPQALNDLALNLQARRDRKALEYAERADEELPGNPDILDTLGWIQLESDQTEKGLTTLQEAATQAPDNLDIRFHLAVALQRSGNRAEASRVLTEALSQGLAFESRA